MKRLTFLALVAVAPLLAACGSSTSTATSPSTISRCAVTLGATDATLPAQGGTGQIAVTTARECQWTAAPDVSWLSIRGNATGQGDGSVEFAAAANPDPVTRRGGITLNNQRAEIVQAAAPCTIQLGQASASFTPAGGQGSVDVRASSALCTWTASVDVDWITIRSASGKGSASVTFDVAATSGPPRTGTIAIGDQRFSVIQSQGCTYAVEPASQTVGPSGGRRTVSVQAASGCPWTAASNAPWIRVVQGESSSGPGVVTFDVAESAAPTRTGTLVVAGQTVTVTQTAGCSYTVAPLALSVPPAGGSGSVSVQAPEGCGWGAKSNASWITLTGGTPGFGAGTVTFTAAAATGPARSGTIDIAGQLVTISQGQGCTYSISPESQSVDAGGGTGTVTVSAGEGCGWNASSAVDWVTITSGASGSGNGTVRFSVAASGGPPRSGALTIAGRTFTVTQGQGCSFALSSGSTNVPRQGGSGSFDVQTAAGCSWTATSNAPWISVTEGAAGTGNGTVRFTAAANTGPARSGTITAGGRTFTIQQEGGCSYAIAPTQTAAPSTGGAVTVNVTASGGCGWTATSNVPWIAVTSGATGTGDGAVQMTIAANTDGPRTGTVTIAGHEFRVEQGATCTYTVNPPPPGHVPGGATSFTTTVDTSAGCGWTASSDVPWMTIASGATGNGTGDVQVSVQANPGSGRSGTLTIAGQTFGVTQDASCSFAVAPQNVTAPAAGSDNNAVAVTSSGGCGWTAVSNAPWITVTSGASGTGNGEVRFAVQTTTGPARSGTLTIAGLPVTVNQESGCTYTLSAPGQTIPAAGGPGSVTLTTTDGCAWTAVSNVPWVAITSEASGTASATIQFAVQANGTGAPRSGTLTIGGQTFTISQE